MEGVLTCIWLAELIMDGNELKRAELGEELRHGKEIHQFGELGNDFGGLDGNRSYEKQSGTFSSTGRLVWINCLKGKLSYAWPATCSARSVHSDDTGRQLGDQEWTWRL